MATAVQDAVGLLSTMIGTEADSEGAIELQVAELRAALAGLLEHPPREIRVRWNKGKGQSKVLRLLHA